MSRILQDSLISVTLRYTCTKKLNARVRIIKATTQKEHNLHESRAELVSTVSIRRTRAPGTTCRGRGVHSPCISGGARKFPRARRVPLVLLAVLQHSV